MTPWPLTQAFTRLSNPYQLTLSPLSTPTGEDVVVTAASCIFNPDDLPPPDLGKIKIFAGLRDWTHLSLDDKGVQIRHVKECGWQSGPLTTS
jgi:hypothetical protein